MPLISACVQKNDDVRKSVEIIYDVSVSLSERGCKDLVLYHVRQIHHCLTAFVQRCRQRGIRVVDEIY